MRPDKVTAKASRNFPHLRPGKRSTQLGPWKRIPLQGAGKQHRETASASSRDAKHHSGPGKGNFQLPTPALVPRFISTYSGLNPSQPSDVALGLKASANRDLHTQGKRLLSPVQLLQLADAEPSRDSQRWGCCRGQRSSAPSLARGKPPLVDSDQSSQNAQTSRDFLPHVTVGGRAERYWRLLADMRERWGRSILRPSPSIYSGFCLASRKVSRVLPGEADLGGETKKGRPGGRVLHLRGRGWFSWCCGWYFAVGEALRSPGSIFPMGYWEN